jgi:hypothetical protein
MTSCMFPRIRTRFFTGLDLGQSKDYTAIAVAERVEVEGPWDPARYTRPLTPVLNVRYLQRIQLGTPYPDIIDQVVAVTRIPELAGFTQLAVDATGVGRPIVDMLRRSGLKCAMLPAIITGGDCQSFSGGYYRLPKRDLITRVIAALQRKTLRFAAFLPFADDLTREMVDMEVRVTSFGTEQFGAWREGAHDDLIFAVALACWAAENCGVWS